VIVGRIRAVVGALVVAAALHTRPAWAAGDAGIPILVYHRFGPTVVDRMTVRTSVLQQHVEHLEQHGYTVVPLRALVAYRRGEGAAPPSRSVVITVDDDHRSVHTEMLPLLRRHRLPITLFVYPSAVSRAAYAMTWEQLRELAATGLVEIQSHTYWHPNFAREKKRLSRRDYERLVEDQLRKSRSTLEHHLGTRVDMLSWPFGIYDDELTGRAARAGYIAAVTLDRRHATMGDSIMALPRYLVTDEDTGPRFQALLEGRAAAPRPAR
jgi:peptidoglycan/xylan/chitin deacetylase (PgdA/CDA1 family)